MASQIKHAYDEPHEMTQEARRYFSALGKALVATFGPEAEFWTLSHSGLYYKDGLTFIAGYSKQMKLPPGSGYSGAESTLNGENVYELFVPFGIDGSETGGFYVIGTFKGESSDFVRMAWVKLVYEDVLLRFIEAEPNLYGVKPA